jgi:hypothetical protein
MTELMKHQIYLFGLLTFNTTMYDWINETSNLFVCPFDLNTTRYDWISETWNLFVLTFTQQDMTELMKHQIYLFGLLTFNTTRYDWINETSNLFVWPFDF